MKKKSVAILTMGLVMSGMFGVVDASIYHIDQFVQYNGTNTFTDTFSDGMEPPAGPISGSDYAVTIGTFGNNRETGGLLELNSDDGGSQDGGIELVAAVSSDSYFFNSGSGGFIEGIFEINNGFSSNSGFFIGIDNYQMPGAGNNTESAGMGVFADSVGGAIYAHYGHNLHGIGNDNNVDITSAFGTNTKITMRFSVDSVTNNVTSEFDFGSDGTIDLTGSNYSTLQFIAGQYTGNFQTNTAVPIPPAVWLLGSGIAGLAAIRHRRKNS